jgi:predicted pyridoxine 5'-phosphate oxidase superfamily flavin-nucleotide-binding protein
MIQSAIPVNTHEFLSSQRLAVLSAADREGRVWASLLTGGPGFMTAITETRLGLDAAPAPSDPLAEHVRDGMLVGLLLIDPRTRKRLRINGEVASHDDRLDLAVDEVYPNCQKYIHQRSLEHVTGRGVGSDPVQRGGALNRSQQERLEAADTFFIASLHPDHGADVSHRGGDPGFVTVIDEETISFPDYSGNNMFNTLGNLAAHPNAGLLFPDFEDGTVLQLTGKAEVIWDDERVHRYEGAERVVEFNLDDVIERPEGNPLRWQLTERSPFNP